MSWKEAEIEEIYDEGYEVGMDLSQNQELPAVGEGVFLDAREDCEEQFLENMKDAEENYRTISPFEFFSKELNEREDDSDEAWEAYEEGFWKGVEDYINSVTYWPIVEEKAQEMTLEWMNEYEVNLHTAGTCMGEGDIIKELDPIMFRQIMLDHMDSLHYYIVE